MHDQNNIIGQILAEKQDLLKNPQEQEMDIIAGAFLEQFPDNLAGYIVEVSKIVDNIQSILFFQS